MKLPVMIALILFSQFTYALSDKRTIILSGTIGEKSFESARQKLEAAKAELLERDVVVETKNAPKFSILLIGKDGGEKWTGDAGFKVTEILRQIDQMPMRRQEMRTRNTEER